MLPEYVGICYGLCGLREHLYGVLRVRLNLEQNNSL